MLPTLGTLRCQAISKDCRAPALSYLAVLTTISIRLTIRTAWFGTSMSGMDIPWFMTPGTQGASLTYLVGRHPKHMFPHTTGSAV